MSFRLVIPVVFFLFSLVFLAPLSNGADRGPQIVVSILPLHSLVAGVMKGVGAPYLLLKGRQSPHHFQLKPSDARVLAGADLVIWVGPGLESPLPRLIAGFEVKSRSFPLIDIEGLTLLPLRGNHIHGDAHDKEQEHAEGHEAVNEEHAHHHADHDHEARADKEHNDHKYNDKERHSAYDPHIWLDVDNAIRITKAVAARLSAISPAHKDVFEENAKEQIDRLERLKETNRQALGPLKGKPYMVFHDAYHYFTHQAHLNFQGAISLNAGQSPSAKHLSELRQRLETAGVACLFTEPQFPSKLADALIGKHAIRLGQLDPLGADLPPGPEAYFQMMSGLRHSFEACLK